MNMSLPWVVLLRFCEIIAKLATIDRQLLPLLLEFSTGALTGAFRLQKLQSIG